MPLPRTEVVPGLTAELAQFEDLIRSFDAQAWAAPTRCAGWAVGDVCAHVVGTISDIGNGRLDELVGGPTSPSARQVAERRGRGPEEVADELHDMTKVVSDIAATFDDAAWAGPPPVALPGTLGTAVEAIWYDTYLHGEDIRAALGRPGQRGAGLRASVSHVAEILTQRGWGPATVALDGMEAFSVGDGGGRQITGDPLAFVLVATGRANATSIGLDPTVNIYA